MKPMPGWKGRGLAYLRNATRDARHSPGLNTNHITPFAAARPSRLSRVPPARTTRFYAIVHARTHVHTPFSCSRTSNVAHRHGFCLRRQVQGRRGHCERRLRYESPFAPWPGSGVADEGLLCLARVQALSSRACTPSPGRKWPSSSSRPLQSPARSSKNRRSTKHCLARPVCHGLCGRARPATSMSWSSTSSARRWRSSSACATATSRSRPSSC